MIYIVLYLFATIASAQSILFIDLNNAPSEIKAVSTGRSVHVVPSFETVPVSTRQKVESVHRQMERLQKLSESCFINESSADCQRLEQIFGVTTNNQFYDSLFNYGVQRRQMMATYKAEGLERDIQVVAESSNSSAYRTVIISGHHSNGYMSGELVEAFQFDVIKKMVARNPNLFSQVKHLIILGCNSGQKDIIVQWQHVFPSTELVVAAVGTAPIKTDPRNLLFIKKLMSQIDGLKHKGVPESLEPSAFLSQIRTSGWPVAILYKTKNLNYVYKN